MSAPFRFDASVFLAHSSLDKKFTRRLARRFSNIGVKVWIDEAEIGIGDSLLAKIGAGIDGSNFLVAVLSSSSVTSNWVQTELEIASTRQISGSPITVLPVVIEECDIPTYIQHKRYADFRNPRRFDNSFEELTRAVLPFDPREQIEDVIRKAAEAEFAAYKALPKIDTAPLELFFTPDGSALARIRNLLVRHDAHNTVISNSYNPSTCVVLDIKIEKFSSTKAEATSKEYWYLRWYDTKAETYIYVLNEQIKPRHMLIYSDGRWKIDIQQYETTTCFMA